MANFVQVALHHCQWRACTGVLCRKPTAPGHLLPAWNEWHRCFTAVTCHTVRIHSFIRSCRDVPSYATHVGGSGEHEHHDAK
jgi:hypothetical protein